MTKCLKFLRVATLLRGNVDPDKISIERYEEILSEKDPTVRDNLVIVIEQVLSGRIKIDLKTERVSIDGRVLG